METTMTAETSANEPRAAAAAADAANGALLADAQALCQLMAARAYLYTLLHKALGGEPAPELLAVIGGEGAQRALEQLAVEDDTLANLAAFARTVAGKADDPAFLEEARAEFARFFQGPAEPPAYPWEGPYLTHETTVFQPSTLAVRAAYADENLQVRKLKRVPDDHVSIMAAFMGILSERALAAVQEGSFAEAHRLVEAMYRFSQQHMANWLPEYAEQSLHVAKAVLYPQLVHGLRSLVTLDAVFLGEALAWLDETGPEGLAALAAGGAAGDAPTVGDALASGDATTAGDALASGDALVDADAAAALAQLQALDLRGLDDNQLVPAA